jgi:hypothetical protein
MKMYIHIAIRQRFQVQSTLLRYGIAHVDRKDSGS